MKDDFESNLTTLQHTMFPQALTKVILHTCAACYDYNTERYGLQCLCGSLTVQTLQPVLSLPLDDYHRQQGGGHSDHPAGHIIQRVVHVTAMHQAHCYPDCWHSPLTPLAAFLSHPCLVINSRTMSANPYLAAARTPVQPPLGDHINME